MATLVPAALRDDTVRLLLILLVALLAAFASIASFVFGPGNSGPSRMELSLLLLSTLLLWYLAMVSG